MVTRCACAAAPATVCDTTDTMGQSLLRRLGLRLMPLLHPMAEDERRGRKQMLELLRDQRSAHAAERAKGEALRKDVEALRKEVQRTTERLAGTTTVVKTGFAGQRHAAEVLKGDLRKLQGDHTQRIRATISKQSAFLKGLLGSTQSISQQAVTQQQVMQRLARIAAGTRPILVGPWAGEVGFELIYWIPFVRWFVEHFAVDPARLVVVSRGGPVSWYGELAARYVDVFDLAGPRGAAPDGPTLKQRRVGQRDRRLIRLVAKQIGAVPFVLHPTYLYRITGTYLDGQTGVRPMLEMLRYRAIAPPPRTLVPGLPADYVAAKFYFSAAFPDTAENRQFVRDVLSRVAAGLPVVLLDQGTAVDDHRQYAEARHVSLASLGVAVTPANNLEVQTAVVGHARAFVGTYGGFSYLAPMCGVEAVVFHSVAEYYLHHRHLADVAFSRLHAAPLTVIPTHAAGLLSAGLATATSSGAAHRG
ncbi:MAG: hypothetical protein ABL971_01445 [Vicinamibacterales bacterium]